MNVESEDDEVNHRVSERNLSCCFFCSMKQGISCCYCLSCCDLFGSVVTLLVLIVTMTNPDLELTLEQNTEVIQDYYRQEDKDSFSGAFKFWAGFFIFILGVLIVLRSRQVYLLHGVTMRHQHNLADRYNAVKAMRIAMVAEGIIFISAMISINAYKAQMEKFGKDPDETEEDDRDDEDYEDFEDERYSSRQRNRDWYEDNYYEDNYYEGNF